MLNHLLGPDVVIAHANAMEPIEIEVLGETRSNIALVAYTAENVHYGFAPMVELLEAGANVTISTDGSAPYMSFDLWQDVKRTLWHAWLSHHTQRVLPPGKALRMVTIDAAKAMGMDAEVGSLEVGKKADIITVNLNQPHLTPRTFLPQQLAYYVTGQDVNEVWVDGKMLMENGRVIGVDMDEVLELAREEAAKAFERAGDHLEPYRQATLEFWRNARY
jgi:cytosine/adenosine deaminase-related metal-dependent hydrolase